jgi:PAS domain S-box-containing protein
MSPSPKSRILVVDDEPMNVELLQAYLTADYEIIPAYCGSDALELVLRERPDLVLLDVMMPGMNGYQVCEQIKRSSETRFIPVVLVTALSSREDRLKGIESHADDFLTKPVDRLELKMRVMSLLRIKSLHDKVIFERDQAQNYLDIAGVMMLVLDRDQKVVLVNKRATEILGCEEADILGSTWFDIFVPDSSRLEAKQHYFKALDMENESILYYEGPLVAKNGEEKVVSWYSKPIKDAHGCHVGVLSSGEDITLRKKAEEDLQERTAAVESSIDGIAILDENGKYAYFNRAYAGIWGYGHPQELAGRSWKDLYDEHEVVRFKNEIFPELITKGVWRGEALGLKKDGTTFFQEISLTRLEKGCICVVRDTTNRKEAEKQLQQYAQSLKYSNHLKDLFIDIMGHDLMNPAGIAKGFAGMLLQAETDADKYRRLRIVDDNLSRLINMIDSAAQFAKLEDTKDIEFRKMDLGAILRDSADNFGTQLAEKNIMMDIRFKGHYPARVNPIVEGVFANYISNAIKYGPSNSSIILEIGDNGSEWKVNVRDFGDGIPDADKELVFDRFKRLGQKKKGVKGTGLGLAIARRIVDLHGGRAGVETGPAGIGSVFWATFKKA